MLLWEWQISRLIILFAFYFIAWLLTVNRNMYAINLVKIILKLSVNACTNFLHVSKAPCSWTLMENGAIVDPWQITLYTTTIFLGINGGILSLFICFLAHIYLSCTVLATVVNIQHHWIQHLYIIFMFWSTSSKKYHTPLLCICLLAGYAMETILSCSVL